MNKKVYIRQNDEKDCGVACLAMILKYYNINYSINKVRIAIGVDDNGTSMYGLIKGASDFGLKSEGLEGSYDELIEEYEHNNQVPFIAHVLVEQQLEHYIVVYSVSEDEVCIADPAGQRIQTIKKEIFLEQWTGHIVVFQYDKEFEECAYQDNEKIELKKSLIYNKNNIICTLLCTVIISAISLVSTYVLEYFVNGKVGNNTDSGIFNTLLHIGYALIGVYLLKAILEMLRTYTSTKLTNSINMVVSKESVAKIINMPLRIRETYQTGDLLTRINDIGVIGETLSDLIISLSMNITLLVICSIALLNRNIFFFLLTILFMIAYGVALFLINPIIKEINKKILYRTSDYNSYLNESIDNVELIKNHCIEKHVEQNFIEKYNLILRENLKYNILISIENSLINFITAVFNVIILCYGYYLVQNGDINISDLILIFFLTSIVQIPLMSFIDLHPKYQAMKSELKRIEELIDYNDDEDNVELSNIDLKKSIRFDNVSFSYNCRKSIIENVSFNIKHGQRFGIVGKNGSGKTTIAKLLQKLYCNYDGQIFIGDIPLKNYPNKLVRQRIGYVSQEFKFFAGTLRYNLIFDKDITDERIQEVLSFCYCENILKKLPGGLDGMVSEDGNNFSRGEQQKLVLVREFLKCPDIMIFDEVTSNLDKESILHIQNIISRLESKITCIIITHKKEISDLCDEIFTLK
ncbi:MAG: peptidase domain-containing ABC transporter [Lachnospiraceae bacterium]|nr:peptidase domain-containing ABC transporter [Lachnospiraceae bacterium]